MSANPRSQRLIAYTSSAAGQSNAFTCPANSVTLIKSAYFENTSASSVEAILQVDASPSGTFVRLFDQTLPTNTVANWQGWAVLNPGDLVLVVVSAAGIHGWVSGAVLTGPPPFPPVDQ